MSQYKIVIIPQMIIEKPEFTKKAQDFVKAGGTLVMTYRSAVKDVHNNLTFGEVIPVRYSSFTGVTVVETESLQEGQEFPLVGTGICSGLQGEGGIFRDMLEVTDAEVLYSYGDTFYKEFAAITRKPQGKGMVYYVGCGLDESTLNVIMSRIMKENQIAVEPSEDGVEICYRGCGDKKIRIVMNHTAEKVTYKDGVLGPYESRIETVE